MNMILQFGGTDVRANFLEMLEAHCPGVRVVLSVSLPNALVFDLVDDEVVWIKQNIPGFGKAEDEIKHETCGDSGI